jgi:glycosyltransferase involved in cell wall biosynthesis
LTPPAARRTLRILGTRGVPAAHGGFETFAERLSLHLVSRGWRVVVYCQEEGRGAPWHDVWRGVERVHVPVRTPGALGTVAFDWLCVADAARHRDLCLTLGYNTAVFCLRLRWAGVVNLINMDGIEWKRAKWGPLARAWLWANDWAGCWVADHLIADHPAIHAHLRTRTRSRRISTIPYGAEPTGQAPAALLRQHGLAPQRYLTLIARAEPENSVLEAVRGFSRRRRGVQLVVIGDYDASVAYACEVRQAAGGEVRFLGPVYEAETLAALRSHSVGHVHGHQVGGTNPSLVEALGAGNAVIAHDNCFNRWVAADAALYFADADAFDRLLTDVLSKPAQLQGLRERSRARHAAAFRWDAVLAAYERLLARMMDAGPRQARQVLAESGIAWPRQGTS